MRNSFSLPYTHIHTHIFKCINMNCRESFYERMSCFNVKENKKFLFHIPNTHHSNNIFLNDGGGCNKNSKIIRMTTTFSCGEINIFQRNVNLIFKHTPCDSLKTFPKPFHPSVQVFLS